MENDNLCFLVDSDNSHAVLDLLKFDQVSKLPEIDWENQLWNDKKYGWLKIGEQSGTGHVRFIFDRTNYEHLQKAFEVVASFHR